MTAAAYVIREPRATDLGFISETWARGAASVDPWRLIPREIQRAAQDKHMRRCLDTANTVVAAIPNDEDEIVGWMCSELVGGLLTIHWIYVKQLYRCMGTATQIVNDIYPGYLDSGKPIMATQWSKHCQRWIRRRYDVLYDPYMVAER